MKVSDQSSLRPPLEPYKHAPQSQDDDARLKKIIKDVRSTLSMTSPKATRRIALDDIKWLIDRITPIFQKEPVLVPVSPPVSICGDVHGQLFDVNRLFTQHGWPPKTRYLFLGDYVHRGPANVETIVLMFALKLRSPTEFFILRGNHETRDVNRVYGFYDQVVTRYDKDLFERFNDAFNWMPLSALVADRVLCMHGGISPDLKSLDDIRNLGRPIEKIPDHGIIADLLWADPDKNVVDFAPSSRGISYLFGEAAVYNACEELHLDLIARAHQVVNEGYEFFADGHLITLFSAPDYCGQFTNAAGVLLADTNLDCKVNLPSKAAKKVNKRLDQ